LRQACSLSTFSGWLSSHLRLRIDHVRDFSGLGEAVSRREGQDAAAPPYERLLSSDGETIKAGTPLVKGASVVGEVVGEGKEPKIYVFKFKRRKNYRRKTGHRQRYTEVRITDLKLG
jgi:large subunit ribosomal protein L21